MNKIICASALMALCFAAALAQKKLTLKELPPATQKTVQTELKGADIRNISKETEDGVAQYEVETMVNGKHRDFNVDTKGKLLVVEEEATIEAIPGPAKESILKKVGGGKLGMVEVVTRGRDTLYEAAYTSDVGKKREVLVKADGTDAK